MWRAFEGSYSADATRLAYVPNIKWQAAWKRYKGGQTTPVYIVTLKDLALEPSGEAEKLPAVLLHDKVRVQPHALSRLGQRFVNTQWNEQLVANAAGRHDLDAIERFREQRADNV